MTRTLVIGVSLTEVAATVRANPTVQATPVCALLLILAQGSGAPDVTR